MEIDREVVRSRLAALVEYLQELERLQALSYEEYSGDFRNRRTVERLLQLIIEAACDVNAHIVVKKNQRPPADHHFSFVRLAELGILSGELGQDLARSVGLRNRLVHEYESIDDRIVFESIQPALKQYHSYVSIIQAYLEQQ